MTVHFSSLTTCDIITKRTLRAIGRHNRDVSSALYGVLHPAAAQLACRGKLSRVALADLHRSLMTTLHRTENVLGLRRDLISSSAAHGNLSPRDSHVIRFIWVVGDTSAHEEWLDFMGCDVTLSRSRLSIRVQQTEFRMLFHAISRWMQRRRRDVQNLAHRREMLESLIAAMRPSVLLSPAVAVHGTPHTALSFQDGLLLGTTSVFGPEAPLNQPSLVVFDRDGRREEPCAYTSLVLRERVQTEMRTFVDGEALIPSRARLRDALTLWEANHAENIRLLAEAMYYGSMHLPLGDTDAQRLAGVQAAFAEARALVGGPVWQHFAETVAR